MFPGPTWSFLEDLVLRRFLLILVFAVGLTGPSVLAGHSADASVPRRVATRSEQVVRSVNATATVALARPATSCGGVLAGQRTRARHACLLL